MTLYTNDYLEYYLTLVGWLISNGIWDVLMDSGMFALPIFAILLQEWLKARGEGADEGNKGLLASTRIESRLWMATAVIMFAGMPFIHLDLSTMQFDDSRSQQCQYQVPAPGDTGWGRSFTSLNNQSAQVPVWWFFVHSMSKAITGAAVAAIPCGSDLRQMRMQVNNTRLHDPVLAQEVADFTNDCYGYSRAKLFMNRPNLDDELTNDINWIGSRYFSSQPGYYDTYHSRTPRAEWPYDSTRDMGLAQVRNGGGYPTCNQWWADSNKGLRSRLLAQVDSSLLDRFIRWASFMPQEEVNDAIIRQVVSPSSQSMTQGKVYTDYGGQVGGSLFNDMSRATGTVGLTVGTLAYFPAMDVVRQALPMVLAALKMALLICIPLVLMFSTYDLKGTITVSVVQFAIIFVDFWLQLARWIDTTILDALYGANSPHSSLNPLMGMNNTQADMLLNYVMAALFIVLPAFWMTSLAFAGVKAGSTLQGMSDGTNGAQQQGGKGKDTIQKVI
ncbi:conjugal transfer protein TraG N-terminal domain-containing protein [Pseudomonas fluorescens BBc6R8]|uniref:conjugal transfer protein TraG N-terminal domain-containing protein n=1 Tax=Pseudomonas fluorescens TaxID=294 RepID=UPI000281CA38|nr:conjugal transfer protein TraG N-terminal domain-containing protein [Pseudomonas fluorescens]QQD55343.1 conjugal transfer protein TraG N-terminal domain-containing protein [Pseudomonas fluorescens BBc6R8]